MGKNEKAVFPLVMAILASAAFIAAYLVFTVFAVKPLWLHALAFAVPAAVFFALFVLAKKDVLREKTANILTGILTPLFIMGCAVLFIAFFFLFTLSDVTDPSCYKRALSKNGYPQSELISQFPEEIPQEAEDVSFLYRPQFLQGAGEFLLACRLPDSAVRALKDEYEGEAVWTGTEAELPSSPYDSGLLPHTVRGYADENAEILILLAEPYMQGSYNHGSLKLILFGESGRTVFYSSVW